MIHNISASEKQLLNPDQAFEADMSLLMSSVSRKKIKRVQAIRNNSINVMNLRKNKVKSSRIASNMIGLGTT